MYPNKNIKFPKSELFSSKELLPTLEIAIVTENSMCALGLAAIHSNNVTFSCFSTKSIKNLH